MSALLSVIDLAFSTTPAALVTKTTALIAAGALVTLALRRSSAAVRHFVWLVSLGGIIVVTVAALAGPWLTVSVPVDEVRPAVSPSPSTALPLARPVGGPFTTSALATLRGRRFGKPWTLPGSVPAIALLWATGCFMVLVRCVLGHAGVARLTAGARAPRGEWDQQLRVAATDAAVSTSVRLLISDRLAAPITSGTARPVILLPATAEHWDAERRRVVLLHELAHVARHDYLAQLVATLACALAWFNPLAWIAAARLRSAAEHAADDCVLAAGTSGVTYATHLLELASHTRLLHLSAAVAVGMARSTHLEGRFRAMLDTTRSRKPVSPARRVLVTSAVLVALVPVAGLRTQAVAKPIPGPVAADSTFEKTLTAAAGERLVLQLVTGGDVIIHAWDEPRVRLRAHLSGRDWRDTDVRFERIGRNIHLMSDFAGPERSRSTRHRFELWVPTRFDVGIESARGTITMDKLNGEVTYAGGGSISIAAPSSRASLPPGGEIHVSSSGLDNAARARSLASTETIRGGVAESIGSSAAVASTIGGIGGGIGAGVGVAQTTVASAGGTGIGVGSIGSGRALTSVTGASTIGGGIGSGTAAATTIGSGSNVVGVATTAGSGVGGVGTAVGASTVAISGGIGGSIGVAGTGTAGVAVAQSTTPRLVTGRVTTIDGDPVVAATVTLLETREAAMTDSLGRFVIRTRIDEPATLVVRRVGFAPFSQTIYVNAAKDLDIMLSKR